MEKRQMKSSVVFAIVLLISSFQLFSLESGQTYSIDPIRTIGDDISDDYFFVKITTGIISSNRDIFVGDSGGKFIAKYSWDGKFIKRIGQAGQGPGDFLSVTRFGIVGSKLITYDIDNRRICILTPELDILDYIKIHNPLVSGDLIPVAGDRFLCSFRVLSATNGRGRIGFIDAEGKLGHCFFRRDQFGNTSMTRDDLKWALDMMVTNLLIGYDEQSDTILAGFEYPAIPAEFFRFNSKGKNLGSFKLEMGNDLIFPEYRRHFPIKAPSTPIKYLIVRSILNHKNNFLVLTSICETLKD
ncbi:MAG: 6-bladed beta-propeller, partial [Bacteroidales bacterium]|nr:6-bladed beta-propeller [Bacteroidales bacterium]